MNKKEIDVQLLLNDSKLRQKRIKEYIIKKELFEIDQIDEYLISGHISKAEHNLELIGILSPKFDDWKIVAAYYSMYHAALALCIKAGFRSKNHSATLVVLIDNYDNGIFNTVDFEEFAQANFSKDDFLFYNSVKSSRLKASYGTKSAMITEDVKKTISGAKSFVVKARKILRD